jgi:glycosyltransferase involved in cell wall biosynthesis
MWSDGVIDFWANKFADIPKIAYLRRYEFFSPQVRHFMWGNVDALIFVNKGYLDAFGKLPMPQPKRKYYIPNCVDLEQFPLSTALHNAKNIAVVCGVRGIKNLGLAVQILLALPKEYVIHQIGNGSFNEKAELSMYLKHLGIADRFLIYNKIPASDIPDWLKDKGIILSTSINEGNPNNVIEGMATGLKPVIHNWPGAKEQFPEDWVFDTVDQAVKLITEGEYNPLAYREWVEKHYSMDNIKQIHQVIKDVMG